MRNRLWAGMAVALLCVVGSACSRKKVAAAAPPRTPVPVEASQPAPVAKAPVQVAAVQPAEPSYVRPRVPDEATKARIQDLIERIQDAYFDYDKYTLRPDAEVTLKADAKALSDILRQYPDYKLTVEGYCDERGSEEYNLALGDARAKHAKEFLASLGIPVDQMRTISYGKDRPVCGDSTEACWQKNRRAHITQAQ